MILELCLSEKDIGQSKVVKRLYKSLSKGIKLTKKNDISVAVKLSNYLFCDGYKDSAIKLLDSFILDIPPSLGRRDIWGENGQGIILRAHIADVNNDSDFRNQLHQKILNNDYITDETDKYELYLEELEDYEFNIEQAETDTQKYKCDIYGQQALTFLYYYEMLPYFKKSAFENEKGSIKSIIQSCYESLRKAL